VGAIRKVFREPIRNGGPGRPPLRPWDGIYIAQVVKQYAHKRVVAVRRRIVQGTQTRIDALLQATQGGGSINTAYIERLNATSRSRIMALIRRGRALARQTVSLHNAMYLVGTLYNFCTYHKSLRVPLYLPNGRRRWLRRTPAIAAGVTDHTLSLVNANDADLEGFPPQKGFPPSLAHLIRSLCHRGLYIRQDTKQRMVWRTEKLPFHCLPFIAFISTLLPS
jgi:hypothetical protein